MKVSKENAIILFSGLLFFIFLIEIIAPLILNRTNADLSGNINNSNEDIVMGVYNGNLELIAIKESVIVTNPDNELKKLVNNEKKKFNIIYADEDQNGYTIIFKNNENISDFLKIIPSNYNIYVTASLLLKNGSQILTNNEILTIERDQVLQTLIEKNIIDDPSNNNLSFIVEAYLSKSNKEILQVISITPEEKTEYKELSLSIKNIKTISISNVSNNSKIYYSIANYAKENNLPYSETATNIIKLSINNQTLTQKLLEILKANSNETKDILASLIAEIEYNNKTYEIIIKDIDLLSISNNNSITKNVTISKIGGKITSIRFN
ncbi:MAG: hypothetical protein QXJ06_03195 [Candidatus Aenigmatarchaeota archaeon]